ncbi:SRPBCC family protein [Ornithinimicrobium pratense]|uniref:SRPBCC family protein n=1 Tax=Ornithinimicrobium pratense TaxID=2593973 RepID=UPI001788858F|nr:SRPBCC domain-containing protein [Ornithinimicrobium pratense]
MTTNHTPVDDFTELVVHQQVAAPIADVWAAWTTVEGLVRWWWPHWPDTIYEMEAISGGRWSARSEEGQTGVEGEVVSVDEPHVLELTWRWDSEDSEDAVRVELAEIDGGTSVTVRHRTPSSGQDDYRQGWEFVLGNLQAALEAEAGAEAAT